MALRDYVVARTDELTNGQMKEVKAGENDVLLARINDKYYALYSKCTHYGAPLAKGALHGNRLVCPWHHACFDVTSGRRLEAPALDGLPKYAVQVKDGDIIVTVPEESEDRIPNPMAKPEPQADTTFVVVGGGAAGAFAVEGMREAGYRGKIILLTADADLPYDRPNCSKDYLQDKAPEEWMPLRSPEFYEEYGIEIRTGQRVTQIDTTAKRITFTSGEPLLYDKLLVCTGGEPKTPDIPGVDKSNVFLLRSLSDSRRLREAAKGVEKAVVVGSSFIGLEGAMSLQKLGCAVKVVGPDEVPYERVWGPEVGQQVKKWHEEAGIEFKAGRKTERLEGSDRVTQVVLDNGERLDADLVLVGVGVKPATGFLKDLPLEEDGGIRVDTFLHAGNDVYAAGDIAHVPYGDETFRIEHWKVAAQQGYVAGMNMAGAEQAYEVIPFFWSVQQDKNLRYLGHASGFDRIEFDGKPEDGSFLAYYVKDNKVKAVLGLKKDAKMAELDDWSSLIGSSAP